MDEKIVYTLGLKFKRHNLLFEYHKNTNTLTIGRAKNLTIKYVIGVIILILSILISLITETRFFVAVFGGIGAVIISNAYRLSKNNAFEKIFFPDYIELTSKKETIKYERQDIRDIEYDIKNYEDTFNGRLLLTLKDHSKKELLTLVDKNRTYLKSDFEYLIKIFKEHLNLQ